MSPTDQEQLRLSLLRFLRDNPTRFGLGTNLLLQMARNEGRPDLTARELDNEILYLDDKGLIAEHDKVISPENKVWRITAHGRDTMAQTAA